MKQGFPNSLIANNNLPVWLRGDDKYVYCSTVMLNRNIKGLKFPHKASKEEKEKVCKRIIGKMSHCSFHSDFHWSFFSDLSENQKKLMYERKWSPLILDERSQDLDTIIFSSIDETEQIILNVDDHIQVRVSLPGFDVRKCYDKCIAILKQLDLDYAKNETFGYLTSSPAIMTTGLQIEVLTHIPGLLIAEDKSNWLSFLKSFGITLDGFFGFNSSPQGNAFTLCNSNVYQRTEEEILEVYDDVIPQFSKMELAARNNIEKDEMKDIVARAYGTLKYAYKMGYEESLSALSLLKMGVEEKLLKVISSKKVKLLMNCTFPAQILYITSSPPDEIETARASFFRENLKRKKKIDENPTNSNS